MTCLPGFPTIFSSLCQQQCLGGGGVGGICHTMICCLVTGKHSNMMRSSFILLLEIFKYIQGMIINFLRSSLFWYKIDTFLDVIVSTHDRPYIQACWCENLLFDRNWWSNAPFVWSFMPWHWHTARRRKRLFRPSMKVRWGLF